MDKNKGYPLPAVALTEDMVCQLVYYPDKPEYRRALLGSLAYLATWIAWEKESEHKGIDAAISWKNALELTMECWEMACLEQLQDDVAAMLAIMQAGSMCCDDQDVTDGDRYTDRVTDGVGLVPQNIVDAGYASSTSDWVGFDDYKCMIAHVTVDQLEARLREIDAKIDMASPYLGIAAALSGIVGIVVATGGVAIIFGIIAGIGVVSALYFSLIEFGAVDTLADKISTNHDDLACAIYQADGDVNALIALNAEIDSLFTAPEALVLKNMNLGPTLKLLYAGRYDTQDIADILDGAGYSLGDFDCTECDMIGEYRILDEWDDGTIFPMYLDKVGGFPSWAYNADRDSYIAGWQYNSAGAYLHTSVFGLITLAGLTPGAGDTVTINEVQIEYKMSAANAGTFKMSLIDDTGTRNYTIANETTWGLGTVTPSPARVSTYNLGYIIRLSVQDGTGNSLYINSIRVDFDVTQA